MIRRSTQAKLPALLICGATFLFSALGQDTPTAEEILQTARITQMSQEAKLSGFLRVGNQRTPFALELDSGLIRYRFQDPDQEIQLQLADSSPILRESTPPGATPKAVDGSKRLRGTSITYEDLALHFLYWPNPKVIGDDNISTRSTWKIEIQGPRGSQYGVVRLWVDKASGSLMKIEAFDRQGHLAKRFSVVSVQQIEGQWMLKSMRVEEFDPGTRRVANRTYLEIRE